MMIYWFCRIFDDIGQGYISVERFRVRCHCQSQMFQVVCHISPAAAHSCTKCHTQPLKPVTWNSKPRTLFNKTSVQWYLWGAGHWSVCCTLGSSINWPFPFWNFESRYIYYLLDIAKYWKCTNNASKVLGQSDQRLLDRVIVCLSHVPALSILSLWRSGLIATLRSKFWRRLTRILPTMKLTKS